MKPLIKIAALLLLGVCLRAQNWMNPLPGGVNGAPVPVNASCLGSNAFGQLIVGTGCTGGGGGGGFPGSATLAGLTVIDGGTGTIGNITVTGAVLGASVSIPGALTPLPAGLWLSAAVSSSNVATVYVLNLSGASVTLPSNTYSVIVNGGSGGGGSGSGITQLTGDVLAGPGSGSVPSALLSVNGSPGSCGDSTHVCQITTDSKGRTVSQSVVAIAASGGGITQLTGDVTAGPGSGLQGTTLSASGVTAGSYTNLNATVDAKGRITAASNGSGGGGGGISFGAGIPATSCTPGTSGLYQDTSGTAPGTTLYYCSATNVWSQMFGFTGIGALTYRSANGDPFFDGNSAAIDFLAMAQHATAFKSFDGGQGSLIIEGMAVNGLSASVGPTLTYSGSGCQLALAGGSTNVSGEIDVTVGGTCTVTLTWGGGVPFNHYGNLFITDVTTHANAISQNTGASTTATSASGTMTTGDVLTYIAAGW